MPRLLILLVSLALFATACAGDDSVELVVGDETDVATDAVADASAPVDLGLTTTTGPAPLDDDSFPSTTAHWEDTLAEYPLLTVLDENDNGVIGAAIGNASFVLVGDDEQPVFTGDEDAPNFAVTITGWYGTANYIEHTISTWFTEVVDGRPTNSTECGGDTAHLTKTGADLYVRKKDQLPAIRGSSLEWTADGCVENLPEGFDILFDGEITLTVNEIGFELTTVEGDMYVFEKLASEQHLDDDTPATTAVATTTTAPASND